MEVGMARMARPRRSRCLLDALALAIVLPLIGCSPTTPTPISALPSPALSCEGPPTIVFDDGTPIPIVLTCDRAIAAAVAAIPLGHDRVTSLDFGYGRYCPPGWRCGPPAGTGDIGFVIVEMADTPTILVTVEAGPSGNIASTHVGPLPTRPPTP